MENTMLASHLIFYWLKLLCLLWCVWFGSKLSNIWCWKLIIDLTANVFEAYSTASLGFSLCCLASKLYCNLMYACKRGLNNRKLIKGMYYRKINKKKGGKWPHLIYLFVMVWAAFSCNTHPQRSEFNQLRVVFMFPTSVWLMSCP